ncbi:MAG: hypothetical protein IK041_02410 [Bacteroidales bacterium]|nr:hypothetical protein [Bacteroidales bacterium]
MLDRYVDMGIVIVLVVFFLAATERILEGLYRSAWAFFLLKRQEEVDSDLTLRQGRNITALFLYPAALFTVTPSQRTFAWILIGSIAYLTVKYCFRFLLDYVNRTTVFTFIGRMGINYIIPASAMLFLARINIYLSALCAIPVILYLVMETKVIFKNNFSVFFYILYICTLELLPAVLLIRLFVE